MQWFTALSRLTISDTSLLVFFNISLSHVSFLCLQGAFRFRQFFMVGLHIGTNSTPVSFDHLIAVAVLKSRQFEMKQEILPSCNPMLPFLTNSI